MALLRKIALQSVIAFAFIANGNGIAVDVHVHVRPDVAAVLAVMRNNELGADGVDDRPARLHQSVAIDV